nr:hypothetical protein [uncultured Cupriavidus sp.]
MVSIVATVIAMVVIPMIAVVLHTPVSRVVAVAVAITIGYNAATEQRNRSGNQHKNGFHHNVLLFTLDLTPAYAPDLLRDVGQKFSCGGAASYSEVAA